LNGSEFEAFSLGTANQWYFYAPGRYRHEPKKNPWHEGKIEAIPGAEGQFRWTNEQDVSWCLTGDSVTGVLKTGSDCPYIKTDKVHLEFIPVWEKSVMSGFYYQENLYKRIGD
jgi:hypothetical protein